MEWSENIPVFAVIAVIAALVVTAVLLATRRMTRDVVAAVWSPDLGLPTYRAWFEVLRRELNRARRYQHPLAVVVTRLAQNGALDDVSRARAANRGPLATMRAGMLLRELLRDTDVVTYDPAEDRFVLLLTETDPGQARAAVARLDAIVHERAGATLRSGIAMFPQDGLITEDLVALASSQCARAANGAPISVLASHPAASPVAVTPGVVPGSGAIQSA